MRLRPKYAEGSVGRSQLSEHVAQFSDIVCFFHPDHSTGEARYWLDNKLTYHARRRRVSKGDKLSKRVSDCRK
jgi:hypothetical protein